MPKANQMNWQPISQIALISSMIDTALNDTREHLGTLSKAKDRPHVLDDATIDPGGAGACRADELRRHLHPADQPLA
jgi:hypothetical protein